MMKKNDTFTRVLDNEKELPSQYIYSLEEDPKWSYMDWYR